MPIRFAFDLGTTSVGWAVYDLDVALWDTQRKGKLVGLRNLGVRLFDDGRDPQSGDSHAAKRRLPRAMRRQQDERGLHPARYHFMNWAVFCGIFLSTGDLQVTARPIRMTMRMV